MALITLLMFILCVLTFFKLWYDNYYNLTFNFPKSSAPKKFKSCDVVIKFQAALNRFCWGKTVRISVVALRSNAKSFNSRNQISPPYVVSTSH